MKKSYLLGSVCACVYAILLAIPVSAANKLIDSMNITGGTLTWSLPGGIPEVIPFTMIGANTNLVGGYIGVGGSASAPFDPPNLDNILIYPVFGGPISMNFGLTYTAASNLGGAFMPAGSIPGGPVPYGTLDDTLNTIEMDLSSWFGNLNNATDIWAGTGLDDGFTSPFATGTWNPATYEYELTWNSRTPDSPTNPVPGLVSTWTLTGLAYPVTTVSITLDIKPGSDPNSINVKSKGVTPIAILTTDIFDAMTVDSNTVCFGDADDPAGNGDCTEAHGKDHFDDVDGDGDLDMVLHFETKESGIESGDEQACLTGMTFSGDDIEGCDDIAVK
jgi:hypothetical protein